MKISAGICIIYNNKILLCHPTNSSWLATYSPPKGGLNEFEDLLKAAIRETKEEIGINILDTLISNTGSPIEIVYKNKLNRITKIVYIYTVYINNLSEINLTSEIIAKEQLQLEEVDWAGFLSKEEIEIKMFHRFLPLLNLLK